MLKLEKYSFGLGDRFAQQGKAQLRAIMKINEKGQYVVPIWNKSFREHLIVGTSPEDVRIEADNAVAALNWKGNYYIDADHINGENVDSFLQPSNYFTIDIAKFIGQPARGDDIQKFIDKYQSYFHEARIPNASETSELSLGAFKKSATKYLLSIKEAGKVYRYIESIKGKDNFITEISMDETDIAQTPLEMFIILAGMADEGIPIQTIAPKFQGRFNKGVDYVGDIQKFSREFENHLILIKYMVKEFGLPDSLKLSVHSGSDKFSIYGPMKYAIKKHNTGLHIKTAGTTWLEEVIGLASAGEEGLILVKDIFISTLERLEELIEPYADVTDIVQDHLPSTDEVNSWGSEEFVNSLRHNVKCSDYNPDLRQLLHVGFKVAVEMENRYTDGLKTFEKNIAENVFENILKNHLNPLFL